MISTLLHLPPEILKGDVLTAFCCPKDLARFLAASRDLRDLRVSCVSILLEEVFATSLRGAHALSWVRKRHGGQLDDLGLVDWLHDLRHMAASGAYRASLGPFHTVVLTPGGRAFSAGVGRHGRLGTSGNMNSFFFTEVDMRCTHFPGHLPIAAVACGYQHTLFLSAVGTVHSCGHGEYGRLGHGDDQTVSQPKVVEHLLEERITRIAAGVAHSVAVSWDGNAYTWGWGFRDMLGHGDEVDRFVPTRVHLPPPSACVKSSHVDGGSGEGRDRVTCAATGSRCTILGMRSGRILLSGQEQFDSRGRTIRRGFDEIGRLKGGESCWRVEHFCLTSLHTVLVIDEHGQLHIVSRLGEDRVVWSDKNGGSKRGRCTKVFVSKAAVNCKTPHVYVPDGLKGWGTSMSCVAVTEDGSLMTSQSGDRGPCLIKALGGGVVCAAGWMEQTHHDSHGLLLTHGGATLQTWGSGRFGNLGHGGSAYQTRPKDVMTAVILGATPGADKITVSETEPEPCAPEKAGAGKHSPRRGRVSILSLADAAADDRDAREARCAAVR